MNRVKKIQEDSLDYFMQNNLSLENKALSEYFENSTVPHLLVDSGLILRDYTSAAGALFSLENECLGKNVCGIKNKINHKAFVENIRGVLMTERVLQKEIKILNKRNYLLCIQPFFSKNEEAINGVIITYIEIGASSTIIKEN